MTDVRITCPKCGAKNPKGRNNCWKCQVDLVQAHKEVQQAILVPTRKRPLISMRTWVVLGNIILIAAIILGVYLALNNPKRGRHLEAVSYKYKLVTNLAQEESNNHPDELSLEALELPDVHVAQWFNKLTAQERRAYFNQFNYYNLLLFSFTAYKGKLQTIGFHNHVWHRFDIDQAFYNIQNSRTDNQQS